MTPPNKEVKVKGWVVVSPDKRKLLYSDIKGKRFAFPFFFLDKKWAKYEAYDEELDVIPATITYKLPHAK